MRVKCYYCDNVNNVAPDFLNVQEESCPHCYRNYCIMWLARPMGQMMGFPLPHDYHIQERGFRSTEDYLKAIKRAKKMGVAS